MATMSVSDLLAVGRLNALKAAPYFGSMIKSLVPTVVEGLGTIGVTKDALLVYDPEWVARRSPKEMGALYWHEVMHLVLDHHGRRGSRHPLLWNIAGDIFINDQGRSSLSLEFPPGGCFPEKFRDKNGKPFERNLSANAYYDLLLEAGEAAAESVLDGLEGEGSWKSGRCGSGAGNDMDDEPDGASPKMGGRSESEIEQTRLQVALAVKQHQQDKGHGRGSLPLGLDRWAEEKTKPAQVPWQTVLARQIRQSISFRPGAVDYSYSRISRRQAGVGFGVGCPILPALIRPVPDVMVVLDTSGSMSTEQLLLALAETNGVLLACGSEITFMACDHAVHSLVKVTNIQQLAKHVKGGGGSSFVPAIEQIEKMRRKPQLVIFATDGDIGVPAVAPSFAVIWLLVDTDDDPAAPHRPTKAYGRHVCVSSKNAA